jgi:hypothetical protein
MKSMEKGNKERVIDPRSRYWEIFTVLKTPTVWLKHFFLPDYQPTKI